MSMKRIIAIFAILLIPASLWILILQTCAKQHSRPIGHSDISLDISRSGDTVVLNAVGKGGRDLYLLRLDNMQVSRIAETPEYESAPSFTPDGKSVVYAAGIPGDRADHIFIRSIDGSPAKKLTRLDANDTAPRVSPDGTLVAFARDKTYVWGGLAANWNNGGVICLIGIDGSNERQITPDDLFAYAPRFSTDGKSIIFDTAVEGLCFVQIDGLSQVTRLVHLAGIHAVHSPDGKLVAYSKGQYSSDHELFIANSDGTDEKQLTEANVGCFHPVFTPTGDRLIFFKEEWPDGYSGRPKFSTWEIGVDGKNRRKMASFQLFDEPLAWKSP